MDAQRDLVHGFAELEVSRRGEGWIRLADDDEHLDSARLDVGGQLAKRRVLLGGDGFWRRLIRDRRACVGERRVHRVRHRVHGRWLRVADENRRASTMRREIGRDRIDEGFRARWGGAADAGDSYLCGEGASHGFDLRGLDRQAIVGACAGERVIRFDDVETVEVVGVVLDPAPRGELAHVPQIARAFGRQEIGIERDDDVGLGEVEDRIDVLAKRELRAGARVVARHRFPLNPLRGRLLREHLLKLSRQRRRVDRLGENAKSRTFGRRLR